MKKSILSILMLLISFPDIAATKEMPVFDTIGGLIDIRNDDIIVIGDSVGAKLQDAGSTESFTILESALPKHSLFSNIEIRKPRVAPFNRGLMLIGIRTASCISSKSIVDRYGQIDDIVIPSPPPRTPGTGTDWVAPPTDYVYRRPWGKLSFGILEVSAGNCLSRVVIDWIE